MPKKPVLPSPADIGQQNQQASVKHVHDELARKIQELIPKSLNDIVRANKEHLTIRLATDGEVMALHCGVAPNRPPKMVLDDWRFIVMDMSMDGFRDYELYLLGDTPYGSTRITSPVRQIDLDRRLVITNSGTLYGLGKQGLGEPPYNHLAMICAAAHSWGFGRTFGIPHFFY